MLLAEQRRKLCTAADLQSPIHASHHITLCDHDITSDQIGNWYLIDCLSCMALHYNIGQISDKLNSEITYSIGTLLCRYGEVSPVRQQDRHTEIQTVRHTQIDRQAGRQAQRSVHLIINHIRSKDLPLHS